LGLLSNHSLKPYDAQETRNVIDVAVSTYGGLSCGSEVSAKRKLAHMVAPPLTIQYGMPSLDGGIQGPWPMLNVQPN
jgi:hypothetical protein